jgi:hypothetical protein
MVRSFVGLAVGLAREAELHQQFAHRIGADRMALEFPPSFRCTRD